MRFTLAELAERLGGRVVGDPGRTVTGVRILELAGADDLSFWKGEARYIDAARASRAGALLVPEKATELAVDRIVVRDATTALAIVLEAFHPRAAPVAGIHPTAVVDPSAQVDAAAEVGPYAVIGARTRIGAGAAIGAHVAVGADCVIGDGARLHPHVVVYSGVSIGRGSEIHAGSVVGADGFGYASSAAGHRKIPQVGTVEIGAEVEVGALTAIDRALLGVTRIGDGTKIDNLVQVGHNVEVGRHSILCGQVGIAGSARLGDGVVFGGRSGASDHATVGARVQVASLGVAYGEVEAGAVVAGAPAIPIRRWRRQQAILGRLESIWHRLRAVERKLGLSTGDDRAPEVKTGEPE